MKSKELIEHLKAMDPDGDGDVHFGYDYGDHGHNVVAPEVEKVVLATVHWSGYHDMSAVTDEDHPHEDDHQVILLK